MCKQKLQNTLSNALHSSDTYQRCPETQVQKVTVGNMFKVAASFTRLIQLPSTGNVHCEIMFQIRGSWQFLYLHLYLIQIISIQPWFLSLPFLFNPLALPSYICFAISSLFFLINLYQGISFILLIHCSFQSTVIQHPLILDPFFSCFSMHLSTYFVSMFNLFLYYH